MNKKIYIANLSFQTGEPEIRSLFSKAGEVTSVKIAGDRHTGQAKGFAFVEMSTREEGEAAKTALNGTEVDGRSLNVDNAREQEQRRLGGYDGGRSGGGRGGGGRGGSRGGGPRR